MADDDEIITRFMRAYAENRDIAMKTLFYARDIRGGLGERRFFRVVIRYLAQTEPGSVRKNIANIAEFGRFDDILALMGTDCEADVLSYISDTLSADIKSMNRGAEVSLLAKWLPSVNASCRETVRTAKKIARAVNMTDAEYRRTLSSLRRYIRIIENNLRERDYSFEYEMQPSKALIKYRQAFIRNDGDRYRAFLCNAARNPYVMNTAALTPYDIVRPVLGSDKMSKEERRSLDVTWNALENYVNSDNSLVVVDGSGSMYCGDGSVTPAAVAQSLGVYFAERNKGMFRNHFITFSRNPRLVEIKGSDIYEKIRYCMSFNECSNTDIANTFDLILATAVKNHMRQKDMPSRIIIISDMEFDWCANNSDMTNFESAKERFAKCGYRLPKLVFWNVNSRGRQQPVTMNEQGVVLVSGMSPQIFAMLRNDRMDPYGFMMEVVSAKRYETIAA